MTQKQMDDIVSVILSNLMIILIGFMSAVGEYIPDFIENEFVYNGIRCNIHVRFGK